MTTTEFGGNQIAVMTRDFVDNLVTVDSTETIAIRGAENFIQAVPNSISAKMYELCSSQCLVVTAAEAASQDSLVVFMTVNQIATNSESEAIDHTVDKLIAMFTHLAEKTFTVASANLIVLMTALV